LSFVAIQEFLQRTILLEYHPHPKLMEIAGHALGLIDAEARGPSVLDPPLDQPLDDTALGVEVPLTAEVPGFHDPTTVVVDDDERLALGDHMERPSVVH
jgi:hypothetical protein